MLAAGEYTLADFTLEVLLRGVDGSLVPFQVAAVSERSLADITLERGVRGGGLVVPEAVLRSHLGGYSGILEAGRQPPAWLGPVPM